MSVAAVELPSHGLGRTMVAAAMARPPPNSWGNESYSPGHATQPPQDHPAQGLYLPPPSSLVSGSQPTGRPTSERETAFKSIRYPDAYAVPFPARHTSSQLPTPTSEPRSPAANPFFMHASTTSDRPSSVTTSPSGNRPDDLADVPWPHSHLREPDFTRAPLAQPQIQQPRGRQEQQPPHPQTAQDHEGHASRPQSSSYQNRDSVPGPLPGYSSLQHLMSSPDSEARGPSERMRISDLLSSGEPTVSSSGKSKAQAVAPTRAAVRSAYKIFVRQQPIAARSCGFGERDRRVIDPPPIVQMTIEDPNASRQDIRNRLSQPSIVMNCTIWNETGDQDCSSMPEDYRQQRRLMGTLMSSAFVGKDENNEEGCFFCFPDLSCRTPGKFRLKFQLVLVNPLGTPPGAHAPIVAKAMSDVFTVYNAKDFPGMQASTPLTKKLKEQGCLISIKKGNERNQGNRNRYDSDDDDIGNEDEGIDNGPSKPAKRQKRS